MAKNVHAASSRCELISRPTLMTVEAAPASLRVTDLGRLAYARALEHQRQLNRQVSAHEAPPTVWLVEHDPVITISHRPKVASHLLTSKERLKTLGIDLQPTDRGGDITYHGPGQVVAYPIVRLNELGLNLGRYMRVLEQLVIETIDEFGLKGFRREKATGVWIEQSGAEPAKVCALGVRVRKNTTMHGLALNVNPDLSHFDHIVPCGLEGSKVTSLREQLGDQSPNVESVKQALISRLVKHLSAGPAGSFSSRNPTGGPTGG